MGDHADHLCVGQNQISMSQLDLKLLVLLGRSKYFFSKRDLRLFKIVRRVMPISFDEKLSLRLVTMSS